MPPTPDDFYIFIMCLDLCLHVCDPHVCLVLIEARKVTESAEAGTPAWVLGTKPGSDKDQQVP